MKRLLMSMMIAGFPVLLLNAQDGNISQIQAEARTVSRTPEGDRSHYGLWAKDFRRIAHFAGYF